MHCVFTLPISADSFYILYVLFPEIEPTNKKDTIGVATIKPIYEGEVNFNKSFGWLYLRQFSNTSCELTYLARSFVEGTYNINSLDKRANNCGMENVLL